MSAETQMVNPFDMIDFLLENEVSLSNMPGGGIEISWIDKETNFENKVISKDRMEGIGIAMKVSKEKISIHTKNPNGGIV